MKQKKTLQTVPEYRFAALPGWAVNGRVEDLETCAFAAGASLAILHGMVMDQTDRVPIDLLRNRLALRSSELCLGIEGRSDSIGDIRDAVNLARAGDALGPAGDMFMRWRSGAAIGLRQKDWLAQLAACLPQALGDALPEWVDKACELGSPVAQAATLLRLVLDAFPREEASALICADAILARGFGWPKPVPLMALHLKRSALRDLTPESCHRAIGLAAQTAVRMAEDLTRRAAELQKVAPKLRSKGSDYAVALFLREDAVSPSTMLSPVIKGTKIQMTDRSARRLCDRLVTLGVVRELTGRTSFRLYGLP